jgi:hypothetical protein
MKVLLLQDDRTHGKGLPTRTRRIIKAEEGGSSKICLHHNQGAHKEAERKLTKMVMEDKDKEDF